MSGRTCLVVGITSMLASPVTHAWHTEGHRLMTVGAIETLPERVPGFFRDQSGAVAHCAIDPDLIRHRDLPELKGHEGPEHYFDRELFPSTPLPLTRYDYLKQCFEMDLNPRSVGLLPYAVVEWTQRLTIAFAEHRRWPTNAHVQNKCLVYAGIMSHYAADLCQPLHTTIHFDGRVGADKKSPHTGIHLKVDALFRHVDVDRAQLIQGLTLTSVENLMPEVLAEIERSHALVDRVYELEAKLPEADLPGMAGPIVADFARTRARAAAQFIGNLLLSAWDRSAQIELPSWLERTERE